jgi:hypothetical protein
MTAASFRCLKQGYPARARWVALDSKPRRNLHAPRQTDWDWPIHGKLFQPIGLLIEQKPDCPIPQHVVTKRDR